jgi:hypothetical protein
MEAQVVRKLGHVSCPHGPILDLLHLRSPDKLMASKFVHHIFLFTRSLMLYINTSAMKYRTAQLLRTVFEPERTVRPLPTAFQKERKPNRADVVDSRSIGNGVFSVEFHFQSYVLLYCTVQYSTVLTTLLCEARRPRRIE